MSVQILNYEQARVLYDAGVRDIAVAGIPHNPDPKLNELVVQRALAGEWEPRWLENCHEIRTIEEWTFAVVTE